MDVQPWIQVKGRKERNGLRIAQEEISVSNTFFDSATPTRVKLLRTGCSTEEDGCQGKKLQKQITSLVLLFQQQQGPVMFVGLFLKRLFPLPRELDVPRGGN